MINFSFDPSEIKLIMLDRDGVINDDIEYVKSPEEWKPIPGSLEAIAALNKAGYKVVVVTNQSGIARKYFTEKDLNDIHEKMRNSLAEVGGHLDGIFVCPHGPEDNCTCRKPKPGLLIEVNRHFNIPPEKALLVGDSMRDFQAAKAFGCKFILVLTGNGRYTLKINAKDISDSEQQKWIYPDLAAFVKELLVK